MTNIKKDNIRKKKVKKCKVCQKDFTVYRPLQQVCGTTCSLAHARIKQAEKIRKRNAKEKRVFRANDIKTRKAAAKKACHDYIKLRDIGLPCICCNKPMTGQIHAGHWQESGSNSVIRFNELNIHSQAAQCNTFKGGDSGDYEKNLRQKIGDRKVDQLKRFKGSKIRGKQLKRTADDYKVIEQKYKLKIKELESA